MKKKVKLCRSHEQFLLSATKLSDNKKHVLRGNDVMKASTEKNRKMTCEKMTMKRRASTEKSKILIQNYRPKNSRERLYKSRKTTTTTSANKMPSPKASKGTNMMPKPSQKLEKPATGYIPKYKSGQHTVKSGWCIATHLNGKPCMEKQGEKWVPYCKKCMKDGDPSMSVEDHPKFGKMLVAKRDLPKDYYSALWGTRHTKEEMPEADTEWGFETAVGDYVNPVPHKGAQIQFCQCPGPSERVTISFATDCLFMQELTKKEMKKGRDPYGSFLFVTSMAVPKNYQLMMMYAENEKSTEEFFRERGITRCDIGIKSRPAILKKKFLTGTGKKTITSSAFKKGGKITKKAMPKK